MCSIVRGGSRLPTVSSRLLPAFFNTNNSATIAVSRSSPSVLVTSVRTHLGYIPFSGRIGRKLSNTEKFLQQATVANLQPVKKVTYTFDPVRADHHSARNFMFFWNKPKVLETNIKLIVKTEIVDDRSEPRILFDLNDGRQIEIQTSLLTELEIARIANHYLLPLVKEEEEVVATKSAKAASGGKKKGKK